MELIASCGLICSECQAYIATQKNDPKLREKTAKEWSEMYHSEIKKEDINCQGCNSSNGVVFGHCHECKIRACCHEKGFSNCSECLSFPCIHLEDFFQYVPEAKATLEKLII